MATDISVGNLIVSVKAQMTEFKEQMNQAGKSFNKLTGAIEKNKAAIKKTAVAFGAAGAAIGVAFVTAIKSTAAFADNIEKMSARTGVASKDLSALSFIAGRAGTNIGSLENAIKRLQRNMSDAAQGIGEARRAFEFLDIEVMNNDGSLKGVIGIMSEFAEKTKDMTDASKKGALAQELFGRAGTTLLPLFKEGAAGMKFLADEAERYGIVLDEVAVKQGADFVDAILNAQSAIKGLKIAIVEDMVPPLTELINRFADAAANAKDFARANERLVKTIPKLALAFAGLATVISLVMVGGLGLLAFKTALTQLVPIIASVIFAIKAFAFSTLGLAAGITAITTALVIMLVKWVAFSDEVQDDKAPLINVFEDMQDSIKDVGTEIEETGVKFKSLSEAMQSTVTNELVPAINEVTGALESTNDFINKVDENYAVFADNFRKENLSEETEDIKDAFVDFKFKPFRENPFEPFAFEKFDFFNQSSFLDARTGLAVFREKKRSFFEEFQFKPLKGNPFGLFGFDKFDFFGGTSQAGFPADLSLGMFIKKKGDAFLGFKFKKPLKNPFADFKAIFEDDIFGDTDLAQQFRQIATPLQSETAQLLKELGLAWEIYVNGIVGGRPGLPGGAGDAALDELADRYGIHLAAAEQETFDFLVAKDATLPGAWQTFVDGVINVRLEDLKRRYPAHFTDIQLFTAAALEKINKEEWRKYVDNVVNPRDSKMAELRDKYEDRMSETEIATADSLLSKTGSIGIWEEYVRRVVENDDSIAKRLLNFFGEEGADIVNQTKRAIESSVTEFNIAMLEGGSFRKAFNNISDEFRKAFTRGAAGLITEIQKKILDKIVELVRGSAFVDALASAISGAFTGAVGAISGKQGQVRTGPGIPGDVGGAAGAGAGAAAAGGGGLGSIAAAAAAAALPALLATSLIRAGFEISEGTKGISHGGRGRNFAARAIGNQPGGAYNSLTAAILGRFSEAGVQLNTQIARLVQDVVDEIIGIGQSGEVGIDELGNLFRRALLLKLKEFPIPGKNVLGADIGQSEQVLSVEAEKLFSRALGGDTAILEFQRGGVVPGIMGQSRIIMAHSGEEVVRRDDPRHVSNIGQGMMINITGNNINSELDMRRLARMAGDEIMNRLRTKVSVPI